LAQTTFGAKADALQAAGVLAWEVLGSISIGLLLGFLLSLYLRYVRGSSALFVVVLAFVIAEVGQRVNLDPLITALASGLWVRNATKTGHRLHADIQSGSLPVYIIFFAVAGATIHLRELAMVWIPASLYVVTRAAGFLFGGWAACRISSAPEPVPKFVGFGLLPQAGLALALALLFVRTFPQLGTGASALILGVVALNEMIAPILFRMALVRSEEAGRLQEEGAELADAPSAELSPSRP
jgi:Kef-type K+ transport system membrane component KefB